MRLEFLTHRLAVFRARSAAPPRHYSNENKGITLDAAMIKRFQTRRNAWLWFEGQPPSFRRLAAHWVTSAKREQTRESRLATLMACATRGERPPGFPGGPPVPKRSTDAKALKRPSAVRDR